MTNLPRTYQLFIAIQLPVNVTVGQLGTFDFHPGHYVYTGSAQKNIDSRIARHLRADKKLRWHIDYLLANPRVIISRVEKYPGPECVLNQSTDGIVVVKGFGSSDCRAGCSSHLKLLSAEDH